MTVRHITHNAKCGVTINRVDKVHRPPSASFVSEFQTQKYTQYKRCCVDV